MKRIKNTATSENSSSFANTALFGVLAVVTVLAVINSFFLDTAPYLDGEGGAEARVQGIFGLALPFPASHALAITANGVIVFVLCSVTAFFSTQVLKLRNSLGELVGCSIVIGLCAIFITSLVLIGIYPTAKQSNSEVFEAVMTDKYDADKQSKQYVLRPDTFEIEENKAFVTELVNRVSEKPKNMLDDLKASESSSSIIYTNFKLVEVAENEYHLFSYDALTPFEKVSDAKDLGEVTPDDYNKLKPLIIEAE